MHPPSGLDSLNHYACRAGHPARFVAHRSLMPNKLALRASRSGRRARQSVLIQRVQATSGVAHRVHIPDMVALRALPAGRLAALGATTSF